MFSTQRKSSRVSATELARSLGDCFRRLGSNAPDESNRARQRVGPCGGSLDWTGIPRFLARESRLEPGSETVRRLGSSDERALTEFKAICTGVGWDESGLEQADDFRYAHFVGERIVAMAGFRSWREDVGAPCVLTHPSFRQRRLGSEVAKAVIADGRHHGKLMLYQTLESNDAAVHLARALGYERYASHIAVRLNNET